MTNSQQPKICLITGASSGIGYAIARALAAEGHTVVITARRQERLQELDAANVTMMAGDLTDPGFQEQVVNTVFDTYGRCDYLFNCAGSIEAGPVESIDIDKMSAMIRLNVEATFRLTYLVLKRFKAQGSGHVINLSSVMGTKVRPTAGAYAATKFAMEALSEALRMELAGTAINISCIEPGLVMTELHKDWAVHPRESMGIHDPLTVEDIVRTVKFIMEQPSHVRIPKLMILPGHHQI
ncbi:SDR family oxidoreductase [Chitinophaga oryzae]|uniref:SDR family oxidoreductase n=1 Tax=Chitinophaga oryzae TaxID=2725414 RepID=A0AAE6ZD90_9BACT|nr:SDR family oxidoreductase [Chitinophaga oryzae]QJB30843.1 SDR family oxidoreductase [Chitinophaga oryzae]QJB37333.1 SDR family oxidoreductase [Chitinophaga oryzae]